MQTHRVMRFVAGLGFLVLAGCAAQIGAGDDLRPMRERLATDMRLQVEVARAAGSITAMRRTDQGWADERVALPVVAGELVAHATRVDTVTIEGLTLALAPVTIPASVLGHAATLTDVHVGLVAPVEVAAAWTGEDRAQLAATLALQLSWALSVDGVALPLGAPTLPPVAAMIELASDGGQVTAQLHGKATGEVWSWAGLVKLVDLELTLAADEGP
jgi:hypothetical protein